MSPLTLVMSTLYSHLWRLEPSHHSTQPSSWAPFVLQKKISLPSGFTCPLGIGRIESECLPKRINDLLLNSIASISSIFLFAGKLNRYSDGLRKWRFVAMQEKQASRSSSSAEMKTWLRIELTCSAIAIPVPLKIMTLIGGVLICGIYSFHARPSPVVAVFVSWETPAILYGGNWVVAFRFFQARADLPFCAPASW